MLKYIIFLIFIIICCYIAISLSKAHNRHKLKNKVVSKLPFLSPIFFGGNETIKKNNSHEPYISSLADKRNIITIKNASKRDAQYYDIFTNSQKVYHTNYKFYKGPHTDEQISAIIRFGNVQPLSQLISLITKKIKNQNNNRARISLIKQFPFKNDEQIIASICDAYNEESRNNNSLDARAKAHAQKIYLIASRYDELQKPENYLDIGCGDGRITKYFGDYIGAKNIHGVDVSDSKLTNINYTKVQVLQKDSKVKKWLPFPDNTFNIITAFMSLHHIGDLKLAAAEIERIMKPGAYLLIKEHDCWNAFDAMLIDIQHKINSQCYEHKPLIESYGDAPYICHYKNYYGWDKIFGGHLKYIAGDYYYTTDRHEISPTRAFWALYKKQ